MILIDNRVGSKEIFPHLEPGINKELTRLDFADAAFLGRGPAGPVVVGIERKTIPDLVNSMESGRLSGHQLIGLLKIYDYNYIIVEGAWRCDKFGYLEIMKGRKWTSKLYGNKKIQYSAIVGYLNTLTWLANIQPVFLHNLPETGRWLSKNYHWWQKLWERHKSHLQFHTEPPERLHLVEPSLFCKVIKELEGIGWDRAHALAEHYNTLTDIVAGGEKELQSVPGIGKTGAKKILKQLEEVY